MKKFIITEEEKSYIKSLYEQSTTGNTQQKTVPQGLEFKTLYDSGFNKLNTTYQGTWNQGYYIFGDNKINMTSLPHPRSETPITMKLMLSDTPQYKNKETYDFEDNGDYVKNFRTYNFVVYDNTNKEIARFEPDNSGTNGTIENFIFDSNGKKVEWDIYIKGMKEKGKPRF